MFDLGYPSTIATVWFVIVLVTGALTFALRQAASCIETVEKPAMCRQSPARRLHGVRGRLFVLVAIM